MRKTVTEFHGVFEIKDMFRTNWKSEINPLIEALEEAKKNGAITISWTFYKDYDGSVEDLELEFTSERLETDSEMNQRHLKETQDRLKKEESKEIRRFQYEKLKKEFEP